MQRGIQHLAHIAVFHHAAGVHHRDLVGEAGNHRQVMRDPDQRGAEVGAELLRLGKDLALDGHVERSGRLVRHDQFRLVQKRDGDRDALAHAARELMRVGFQPLVRGGDAHHAQCIARALAGFVLRDLGMRQHRLDHLRVDPEYRIQRHHRVLEDHRDLVAAKGAHAFLGQLREVVSLEQDAAADDAARRIDQAHDGKAGDGLARARFADQPQHLAARHAEGDIVHRLHHAGAGEEMRAQVADFECGRALRHDECGRAGHLRNLGFSTSRSWSPTRLMETIVTSSAMPG